VSVEALRLAPAASDVAEFARAVRAGLARVPKRVPARFLYDELGSRLFEAICRLPWYPVARAETRLLQRHAAELLRGAQLPRTLIELGPGSGEKLALLVGAAPAPAAPTVHLVDVSAAALAQARANVERAGAGRVVAHRAEYLPGLRAALRLRAGPEPALVAFLGSNVGNFDPAQARELLAGVAGALGPSDALLLGADLVKPEAELLAAYDDPLGVTAAFDKNLLARMNRELGADFDLAAFRHEARWNRFARRMEMHLVSLARQRVRIPAADCAVSFSRGESLWTESSYKYGPGEAAALGQQAGLVLRGQWLDGAGYALSLFVEVE
jgi:dimethylhistidine N-methyltransferase